MQTLSRGQQGISVGVRMGAVERQKPRLAVSLAFATYCGCAPGLQDFSKGDLSVFHPFSERTEK